MEILTKDNGDMDYHMEKELQFMQMGTNMKVNGKMDKNKEKELWFMKMDTSMKDNG